MKQPILKIYDAKNDDGDNWHYYFKSRKSNIKREPDLVISVPESENDSEHHVFIWFQKYWCYRLSWWGDKDLGLDSVMECPRTGLLMFGDHNGYELDNNDFQINSRWIYFAPRVQKAYREYRATYDLEEAIINTK